MKWARKLSKLYRFTWPVSDTAGIWNGSSSSVCTCLDKILELELIARRNTIALTLYFSLSHVGREAESGFATRPTCLDFNTDHFPNLPSSGNHLGTGRLAKFHGTFVSAGVVLDSCFFLFGGLRDPRNSISSCSSFQPSICITSLDAKCGRISLTTLGAGKWGDYGLLLWKVGSCHKQFPQASSISCSCGMGTRMPYFKRFLASALPKKKTVIPRSAWF